MEEISYPPDFAPFELLLFNTIKHKDSPLIVTAVSSAPSLSYVGTYDGKLILYEFRLFDGLYQCKTRKAIQLGAPGNPIDRILCVPEFASILVLCGGQLHILNMYSFDIGATIPKEVGTTEATMRAIGQFMGMSGDNRVTSFCVQYPRELFRVCCQIRGALMFYEILGSKGEQPFPFMTIPLQENQLGQQMEWTQQRCFVGTSSEYLCFDLHTKLPQPLFTLDNSPAQIVCTNEDLLLVSGRVGVFVDFDGQITRGSVTWSSPPLSVSFSAPYIIALLLGGKIEVHNIHNQVKVQSLDYTQRFRHISSGELLLMATRDQIYCLKAKQMQEQLDQLIRLQHSREAIDLAKVVWADEPQELRGFYTRAGLAWFTQGKFDQAFPVLMGSSIDLRELILLFPEYLPEDKSGFTGEYNYKLNTDVDYTKAKEALLHFLVTKRNRSLMPPILKWTDTALLKLYVEFDDSKVDEFLENSDFISFSVAENCLQSSGALHHLAKLYKKHLKVKKALECMKQIGIEQIIKTGYDPLDDAIELLIGCKDSELVLEYAKWAMKQDPSRAIKIFSDPNRQSELEQAQVLEFLQEFGKYYQIEYMGYLIFVSGCTDETLHTQLGIFCIDLLQEANRAPVIPKSGRRRGRGHTAPKSDTITDPVVLKSVQNKLMNLLRFSEYYNTATLLGRIQGDSMLFDACVVLYSRLGRHKEALDILVHKKQDFEAADMYCAQHSNSAETNLFFDLLNFYMDSHVANASEIPENAFQLMNARGAEFDPLEVLRILPDDIPLEKIESFLRSSSQNLLSEKRTKMIEANLCRMERILIKSRLHHVHSSKVVIDRSVLCSVCRKPIGESVFAAYPNGILVHFKCIEDEHTCPITNRNFKDFPVDLQ